MPDADLSALAPWAVTYPSAGRDLAGFWFVPEGGERKGALIVNHGSGGFRPTIREVAEEFNRLGYAAFLPVRRGYHDNPGPHWRSHLTAAEASPAWGRQVVDALLQENDDVLAALDWLIAQPDVDAGRIGVTGVSFGGIMTLLAAGRTDRFRAAINFAAAAMTWERAPALQEALLDAVRRTTTPLFLIQAQNDFSLAPAYMLGAELARLGKPHETRIYPPNGTTPAEGHGLFTTGIATWSADVERFLDRWLSSPRGG